MSKFKIDFSKGGKKPMFDKKPDYVTIPYDGDGKQNIEADSKAELTELQKQFRDKAKAEADLKKKNTSSEYWSCIIFQDQEQRDKFYELLGMANEDNQYINGRKLIQALQLRIDTLNSTKPGKFRVNKEIADLSIKPIS